MSLKSAATMIENRASEIQDNRCFGNYQSVFRVGPIPVGLWPFLWAKHSPKIRRWNGTRSSLQISTGSHTRCRRSVTDPPLALSNQAARNIVGRRWPLAVMFLLTQLMSQSTHSTSWLARNPQRLICLCYLNGGKSALPDIVILLTENHRKWIKVRRPFRLSEIRPFTEVLYCLWCSHVYRPIWLL